jgi:hypothetical protein
MTTTNDKIQIILNEEKRAYAANGRPVGGLGSFNQKLPNQYTLVGNLPQMTSLQQRLVKTGGRLIKHARYYWMLLAESHLTRRLFASMLHKIAALPLPVG